MNVYYTSPTITKYVQYSEGIEFYKRVDKKTQNIIKDYNLYFEIYFFF